MVSNRFGTLVVNLLGAVLFLGTALGSCTTTLKSETLSLQERREITALAFSPNGKYLVVGTKGGEFREFYRGKLFLWDLAKKKWLASMSLDSWVYCTAFSPDSSMLAVGCGVSKQGHIEEGFKERPGDLLVFQSPSLKEIARIEEGVAVRKLTFSANGKTLASSSSGKSAPGKVKIWSVTDWKVKFSLPNIINPFPPISFSPDGKILAVGTGFEFGGRVKGEVRLYDALSGEDKGVLSKEEWPVDTAQFSSDGKFLALMSYQKPIFREVKTGNDVTAQGLRAMRPWTDMTLSPDGKFLVGIFNRGMNQYSNAWFIVWDLEENKQKVKIEWDKRKIRLTTLAISPNSELLAVGTHWGGEIKIFHLR
jgi:WD40 repeat protein